MVRTVEKRDREQFLAMGKAFYASDAVLHSIPGSHFEKMFDLLLSGSPYAKGYILEREEETVGYALLALTYSNEAGGMVVWIEELYVLPAFRGKGIGGEFLRFVEEEYRGFAKKIRLEVEEGNGGAIQLYEKNGYEVLRYRQMHKKLD